MVVWIRFQVVQFRHWTNPSSQGIGCATEPIKVHQTRPPMSTTLIAPFTRARVYPNGRSELICSKAGKSGFSTLSPTLCTVLLSSHRHQVPKHRFQRLPGQLRRYRPPHRRHDRRSRPCPSQYLKLRPTPLSCTCPYHPASVLTSPFPPSYLIPGLPRPGQRSLAYAEEWAALGSDVDTDRMYCS